MGSVVLHRGLFRLNATCITVALHYSNGRRANSQHSSTQNSHYSRLCACDCLVFKMVIEKTPFHAGTGAGIFPPLSPAKKLLLSILHCDNGISGKRDIRGILNLLHTEMDKQLRHIAIITMMILAASAGSAHGQEVLEQAVICRTESRIVAEDATMRPTAEWRNHIVHEFLKYAATPGDISSIDYCDSYRSVMMDDSTRISVDWVTFPSGDEALAKWLNGIPDSTYVKIDIPAEAPEKCIAFRKETTLIIVWCNLFTDADEVFNRLYEINLPFTDDMKKRF